MRSIHARVGATWLRSEWRPGFRSIHARVGATDNGPCSQGECAVHPRVRGSDERRATTNAGTGRSIHACVGATLRGGDQKIADAVHPRVRGSDRRPSGGRPCRLRSIHACVGATLRKPWTFVALRPSKCPRTRSVGLVRTRTHVQSTRPRRIRKRDRATPCQPKRGRIRERAGEWPSSCVTDRTSTPWSHPRSAAAPNRALGLRPRVDSSAAVRRSTRFVRAMTDSGTSA